MKTINRTGPMVYAQDNTELPGKIVVYVAQFEKIELDPCDDLDSTTEFNTLNLTLREVEVLRDFILKLYAGGLTQ